jgi:hypothetical protein
MAAEEIDEGIGFYVTEIAVCTAVDNRRLTEAFKIIWRQFAALTT